eukprot:6149817-Prymnesium_polylepis.1
MSDETHLKRLKRLEIYWKFQSPGVSVSTAGLKGCHISSRISGNVRVPAATVEGCTIRAVRV